jgi:hypothetical protein
MKTFLFGLSGLCLIALVAGCVAQSEAEITAHVMATLTASAPTQVSPTRTPTVPPRPTITPTFSGEPQDHSGSFTYGFEVIAFKPCNSTEVWWLNGDAAAMSDLRTRYAAITKTMQPVHVKLRGLISERGTYGHMGGYAREFYLQDVLDVRAKQPGDCE